MTLILLLLTISTAVMGTEFYFNCLSRRQVTMFIYLASLTSVLWAATIIGRFL